MVTFEDRTFSGSIQVDDSSKSDNDGASTYAGSSSGRDENEPSQQIGVLESSRVKWLKMLMLIVLFMAAAGVSTGIYLVTSIDQAEEFETKVDGVAATVLEAYGEIVSEKLSALSAFGVSTTSYAESKDTDFPFVTLNNFQQRAGSIREVVDCLLVYTIYEVQEEGRDKWENYTISNTDWYFEDLAYQKELGINVGPDSDFVPFVFSLDESAEPIYEQAPGPYTPIWQSSPLFPSFPNFNVATFPPYMNAVKTAIQTGKMAIGGILTAPPGDANSTDLSTALYSTLLSAKEGKDVDYDGDPMAFVALPIFDSFDDDRKAVGTVSAIMNWAVYFKGIVPPLAPPVTLVLENACDGTYTYEVDNEDVVFRGKGDLHDTKYSSFQQSAALGELLAEKNEERVYNKFELDELNCPYQLHVYPTKATEDESKSDIPLFTTFIVGAVFIFTTRVFLWYNLYVERRQKVVLAEVLQSNALVDSFLPASVQKRLLKDKSKGKGSMHVSSVSRLRSFLSEGYDTDAKPIADLFPFTTVLFADIAGFTAWSSTREPAQVFILLQTLYQAFDALAKKCKVFKVETIGDSYVAVSGLPKEQPTHAVLMARFAFSALDKMNTIVHELERKLGPDTGDLLLRIGLHSGPVTAGVLRGDRPRFQLFGDTVNTAARMESTGTPNRIQVSHSTAAELRKLGKGGWLQKREDEVVAKGKGVIEAYWLSETSTRKSSSEFDSSVRTYENDGASISSHEGVQMKRENRLIDWIVEVLFEKIQQIQAVRQGLFLAGSASDEELMYTVKEGTTSIDELEDVMQLPPYNPDAASILALGRHHKAKVDAEVKEQLHELVSLLARGYRGNPFHNFEHACHVTMAVDKLLKRIVSPNMDGDYKTLHEYTHGLTSDPLLLMAIVMSALIHDVDHQGVSNAQLAKEDPSMAEVYKNKSIAEQNSLEISWSMLMRPRFATLRRAMFLNRTEMLRFRQVIVNMVLATDIFDKELNDLRKARWAQAFENGSNDNNLRATIVMEHIIQASDVSHTMQHWHIYRKWNERLFTEMSHAFEEGRMGKDPADFWYQGELGFFDNYIIPLAKKLKECNVFGVSSDECLTYAMQNRREWEQKGEEIVAQLVANR